MAQLNGYNYITIWHPALRAVEEFMQQQNIAYEVLEAGNIPDGAPQFVVARGKQDYRNVNCIKTQADLAAVAEFMDDKYASIGGAYTI